MEKLAWLFPHFSTFYSLTFESQLSAVFVGGLLLIFFIFIIKSLFSFGQAVKRVAWFNKNLKDVSIDNVALKRVDLQRSAQTEKKGKNVVGHLWKEFDDTLIEVRGDGSTQLFNTFDADYFFNTSTLAKGVTDNRLIAAVPGFLTAIGVIGTFVGLQLGMSGMDMTGDVAQMKLGIGSVIEGAKIAFMTSIWGVTLSVLFNLIEKVLEQWIRTKITTLQTKIDEIFPRLSPEVQLQVIADNSSESRECLQGLAEQIGISMQESMLTATTGISEALATTLNDIMAPAINKLVNETSEGNQKALEDLLTKFMDGFGAQGNQQRVAMDNASEKVNESISGMNNTMEAFITNFEASQHASVEREQALISSVSQQVTQLVEQGNEQSLKMTELMGTQLSSLNNAFQDSQIKASQREVDLTTNMTEQITSLIENISIQNNKISDLMESQLTSLNSSFQDSQTKASERENDLTSSISEQIKSLIENISMQNNKVSDLMGSQLTSLNSSFQDSQIKTSQREVDLTTNMTEQITSLIENISIQNNKISDLMESQLTSLNTSFQDGQTKASQREVELTSNMTEQIKSLIENISTQNNKVSDLMESQLTSLNSSFKDSQNKAAERESELTNNMSDQIELLVDGVTAQTHVLTEFVSNQMSSLNNAFETREAKTAHQAEQRNSALAAQTSAISSSTEELVNKIESSIQKHQASSEQVLQQGKSLQQSVETSVVASSKATASMRETASELKSAAENVNLFGSHVRDAGNKLSGAVSAAVETTKDLATQNQRSSERMDKLRTQLIEDTARFKEISEQINQMIINAGNTFSELKSSQAEYLKDLKLNVSDLSKQMTSLLSNYSEQANSQTAEHLRVWANSSSTYAVQMNNAAKALSSVVDEIQDKVGA